MLTRIRMILNPKMPAIGYTGQKNIFIVCDMATVTIVHDGPWTVITLSSLHSLSPPPGQEHANFSHREMLALLEHHCCQSVLCVVDGSRRMETISRVGFKLCTPGT